MIFDALKAGTVLAIVFGILGGYFAGSVILGVLVGFPLGVIGSLLGDL